VLDILLSGEAEWEREENPMGKRRKNPHAVELGRRGGLAARRARMEKMTPEERTAVARKAALARWAKYTKGATE
jgi:hypothetical protein